MRSKVTKVGIIGGSGVNELLFAKGVRKNRVKTAYGSVMIEQGELEGKRVFFVKRHGEKYVLPYEVNYRANIAALKRSGVDCILATAASGAIDPKMKPGDFATLSDFIDFTKRRHETFSRKAFIDVSSPYDPDLNKKIEAAAAGLKLKMHKNAVYVCTEGPRFESKAEIRMFWKMGAGVVGMTQAAEVVLAAEAGIPYAVVAVVTNYAAGVSAKNVSAQEVLEVMEAKKRSLSDLLAETIKTL